jgi:hypothetical protein
MLCHLTRRQSWRDDRRRLARQKFGEEKGKVRDVGGRDVELARCGTTLN